MKPFNDTVILTILEDTKIVKDPTIPTTKLTALPKPSKGLKKGKVIANGPGRDSENPTCLVEGDIVLFEEGDARLNTIEGIDYLIIRERDLVAKL